METALIGAVIAAGAAIAAAVVSLIGAHRVRRAADRDHAWDRFTWAVAQPDHDPVHDISIAVLRGLADVAWWSKADRRLADRALRRRTARPSPRPTTKDCD